MLCELARPVKFNTEFEILFIMWIGESLILNVEFCKFVASNGDRMSSEKG